MTMIDNLLLPFQFQFMTNAFLISLLVSIPSSFFSCYLILKGWALMGDAISHAVLPGIVLAYIVGFPLLLGAFIAGMVCALTTGFLSENSRVKEDTILGIVFSGMFGLGIFFYSRIPTGIDLDHILFGNILGINKVDISTSAIISLIVTLTLLLKRSDFLMYCFDPFHAASSGFNIRYLHYGLLVLLSLTVVSNLSSVGIILTIGFLIAPGAIAFLVSNQFKWMIIIALTITLLSCFTGVYLSFYIDSAPAPTIILILSFIFIVFFLFSQFKNLRHL